jgi:putative sterol carrier protein
MTLEEAAEALKQRLAGKSPLGGVVKFDLGSNGALAIDGKGDSNVVTTTNVPADTTIGMTFNDMVELFHGRLNPTVAFMQGKMKIDGDMGLAMELAQIV